MGDRYVEAIERAIMAMTFASGMPEVAAAYDFTDAIKGLATALREQDRWYEIDDPEHPAPRDGKPVLVRLKDPIPNARDDLRRWDGVSFIARNRDDLMHWCFAAPVGQGGFPDEWIAGWRYLPAPADTGDGT